MNQTHDTKNVPRPTSDEAITRRRIKKFNDQLKERPGLFTQFESILGIAADRGPGAPFRTADQVEALVIDAMRKLGNHTIEQWAHAAQARAVEDCKSEHPGARLKKKSSLRWWCAYGEVCIEEVTLRTATLHSLRPFARRAQVSCRGKSARLQRAMTDFGIEKSFAAGNRQLLEHYGFELSASATRELAFTFAPEWGRECPPMAGHNADNPVRGFVPRAGLPSLPWPASLLRDAS